MADARLRELERRAASGDPQAEEALRHFREKIDPPENRSPFHDLGRLMRNMGISIQDLTGQFDAFSSFTRTFARSADTADALAYAVHAWNAEERKQLRNSRTFTQIRVNTEINIRDPPED